MDVFQCIHGSSSSVCSFSPPPSLRYLPSPPVSTPRFLFPEYRNKRSALLRCSVKEERKGREGRAVFYYVTSAVCVSVRIHDLDFFSKKKKKGVRCFRLWLGCCIYRARIVERKEKSELQFFPHFPITFHHFHPRDEQRPLNRKQPASQRAFPSR